MLSSTEAARSLLTVPLLIIGTTSCRPWWRVTSLTCLSLMYSRLRAVKCFSVSPLEQCDIFASPLTEMSNDICGADRGYKSLLSLDQVSTQGKHLLLLKSIGKYTRANRLHRHADYREGGCPRSHCHLLLSNSSIYNV